MAKKKLSHDKRAALNTSRHARHPKADEQRDIQIESDCQAGQFDKIPERICVLKEAGKIISLRIILYFKFLKRHYLDIY